MIIDAHAHGFYGGDLNRLEAAGGEWTRDGIRYLERMQKRKPYLLDVGLRLEILDRNGIDLQVVNPVNYLDCNLLPGTPGEQLRVAEAINDNMARLTEASRGRLIPVGNVPLQSPDEGNLKEMRRAVKELGLKALCVPTNMRGTPIDLPEFEPFWAHAAEMNIPVYIHPADPVNQTDRSYEKTYDLTHSFGWPFETALTLCHLVFSGIMSRYPTLKIVSHHLGGGLPFFWGRLLETQTNVDGHKDRDVSSLPKPLFDYFSRFYYDTAVGGGGPAIRCAYEVFGADQLVFATDAPWGPGTGEFRLTNYPKIVQELKFSETDNQKIFEGNIRKVLNLS